MTNSSNGANVVMARLAYTVVVQQESSLSTNTALASVATVAQKYITKW